MSKQSLCSHRLEGRVGGRERGGSGHPLGAVRASTALSTVINPQPCDPLLLCQRQSPPPGHSLPHSFN